MLRLTLISLVMASIAAFQISMPTFVTRTPSTIVGPRIATQRSLKILSDEETESIMQSATECAEGECSIDDVADLIGELKEQEKILQNRLEQIMNMIAKLQHINEKAERKTDEVRQFVRDMLRVFNTDKPTFFPTGFTGDIGDGPMTAYDVLAPKKWTPPKSK